MESYLPLHRHHSFTRIESWTAVLAVMVGIGCLFAALSTTNDMVWVGILAFILAAVPLINRPFRFHVFHYVLLALGFFMLIAFFATGCYGSGIFVSSFLMWALVFLVTSKKITHFEIKLFFELLVYGTTLFSVFLAASNYNIMADPPRTAIPMLWFTLNANILPYFIVPVMLITLARILVKITYRQTAFFIINTYAMLVCKCRGAFVGLVIGAVCVLVYMFVCAKNRKTILKKYAIFAGILAVGVLAVLVVSPDTILRLLSLGDGSGRDSLWKEGLDVLDGKWLFGRGWGYYNDISGTIIGLHNLFLQTLVQAGVFSTIAIGAVYIAAVIKSRDLLLWGLFATSCVATMVENGYWPMNWVMITLVVAAAQVLKESNLHALHAPRHALELIADTQTARALPAFFRPSLKYIPIKFL